MLPYVASPHSMEKNRLCYRSMTVCCNAVLWLYCVSLVLNKLG